MCSVVDQIGIAWIYLQMPYSGGLATDTTLSTWYRAVVKRNHWPEHIDVDAILVGSSVLPFL